MDNLVFHLLRNWDIKQEPVVHFNRFKLSDVVRNERDFSSYLYEII
jgi:hypothetical protein